jgi:hypothetical protein
MIAVVRKVLALAGIALNAASCHTPVPKEYTSLIRPTGQDPGKPSKPLSMVWLHHSTGDRLLRGGLLDALQADGVVFHDINYREAMVDGYVIGDHTDIADWPKAFNTPKFFDAISTWELAGGGKHHDIVMFKSCYPNSNITSDAMLDRYKKDFNALLPTFAAHPDILFIAMSTPPLVKKQTTPEAARRAREWAHWLVKEYAPGAKNVKVFDLFDVLAIDADKPNANTLVPQFATGRGDSHPSPEGAQAMTRLFIPWFNRIVREAGLSQ